MIILVTGWIAGQNPGFRIFFFEGGFLAFAGRFGKNWAEERGPLLVNLWCVRGELWSADGHDLGQKIRHAFWIYFADLPFWEW